VRKKDKIMTIKTSRLLAVLVSVSFVIPVLRGSAMGINTGNLFNEKLKDRRAAYEEVVSVKDTTERQQIILSLIEILRREEIDRTFEGPLHLAIKALGVLKAEEAVPDMLPYFTFVPEGYRVEEIIPTQWYYPTARAFVEIGKPVTEYMDSIIVAENQSDEAKRLAAWVIKEVEGKEMAMGKMETLEQKHVSSRLKSGEKLSVYIRDFKPTFNHPHKTKDLSDEN
jgi:hypothetical protein